MNRPTRGTVGGGDSFEAKPNTMHRSSAVADIAEDSVLLDAAWDVRGSASRDERLDAIRRVDWRFLMEDPTLGQVALLGDDDPGLVRALRWFSASLSLIDLNWNFPPGQAPRFDQVVLRSRRAKHVPKAAALVQAGGTLYWEIERGGVLDRAGWLVLDALGAGLHALRHVGARRHYEPLSLRPLRRRLEAAGFEDVRWHWHRPDFREALDIVPLQSGRALDHLFGKHHGRRQGRVKRRLGGVLRSLGLLHLLVPCVSVLATKKAAGEVRAQDARADAAPLLANGVVD